MIKGNNTVRLNKATMRLILQDWFDRNAPLLRTEVVGVTSNLGDNVFDVEITEKVDERTGAAIPNN